MKFFSVVIFCLFAQASQGSFFSSLETVFSTVELGVEKILNDMFNDVTNTINSTVESVKEVLRDEGDNFTNDVEIMDSSIQTKIILEETNIHDNSTEIQSTRFSSSIITPLQIVPNLEEESINFRNKSKLRKITPSTKKTLVKKIINKKYNPMAETSSSKIIGNLNETIASKLSVHSNISDSKITKSNLGNTSSCIEIVHDIKNPNATLKIASGKIDDKNIKTKKPLTQSDNNLIKIIKGGIAKQQKFKSSAVQNCNTNKLADTSKFKKSNFTRKYKKNESDQNIYSKILGDKNNSSSVIKSKLKQKHGKSNNTEKSIFKIKNKSSTERDNFKLLKLSNIKSTLVLNGKNSKFFHNMENEIVSLDSANGVNVSSNESVGINQSFNKEESASVQSLSKNNSAAPKSYIDKNIYVHLPNIAENKTSLTKQNCSHDHNFNFNKYPKVNRSKLVNHLGRNYKKYKNITTNSNPVIKKITQPQEVQLQNINISQRKNYKNLTLDSSNQSWEAKNSFQKNDLNITNKTSHFNESEEKYHAVNKLLKNDTNIIPTNLKHKSCSLSKHRKSSVNNQKSTNNTTDKQFYAKIKPKKTTLLLNQTNDQYGLDKKLKNHTAKSKHVNKNITSDVLDNRNQYRASKNNPINLPLSCANKNYQNGKNEQSNKFIEETISKTNYGNLENEHLKREYDIKNSDDLNYNNFIKLNSNKNSATRKENELNITQINNK